MRFPLLHPKPQPPSNRHEQVIPNKSANFFDRLSFGWLFPLLKTGYSRTLEEGDVWRLDEAKRCQNASDRLERHFYSRCPPSLRPRQLLTPTPKSVVETGGLNKSRIVTPEAKCDSLEKPTTQSGKSAWKLAGVAAFTEWRFRHKSTQVKLGKLLVGDDGNGKERFYDASLVMALLFATWRPLSVAIVLCACNSVINTTSSLITKRIITHVSTHHRWEALGPAERLSQATKSPSKIGNGIALAFGLALMQLASALTFNHSFARSLDCGIVMKSALMNQIAQKSLRLSLQSRLEYTSGKQISAVITDASYVERAFPAVVNAVIDPLTIIIGFLLLIFNLGPSALVGVAILAISSPVIASLSRGLSSSRRKQLAVIDRRIRLVTEMLSGIRQIKLFAYEGYFERRVLGYREKELARLRDRKRDRSTMDMVTVLLPTMAAVLSFLTYSLAGNNLDTAKIFASLQLFNVIRTPIQGLPKAISNLTDAHVAIVRLSRFLIAEDRMRESNIGAEQAYAVEAIGNFVYEEQGPPELLGEKAAETRQVGSHKIVEEKNGYDAKRSAFKPSDSETGQRSAISPFSLQDIDLRIPRGSFVAVYGRIGSGKSALLQALVGEMRTLRGHVRFNGSTSLVTQTPWIQNATVEDNILFGKELNVDRMVEVVHACALKEDLEALLNGLQTEIGERGINLSGGQRARVALARAAYFDADIALMDDPLSAVDSHVSSQILTLCLLGWMKDKTRILVTHHLDVARYADIILVMDQGRIAQQGSFQELASSPGIFQTLLEDYGNINPTEKPLDTVMTPSAFVPTQTNAETVGARDTAKLLLSEDRATGKVPGLTYLTLFKAMGLSGFLTVAVICSALGQCSQIGSNLFLGFWSGGTIAGFRTEQYMGIYAGLGGAFAVLTFVASYSMGLAGLRAAFLMLQKSLRSVLRAPTSFHDRTPTGRITSRLTKDVEVIDDQLATALNDVLTLVYRLCGSFALVLYAYPYLGGLLVPMAVLYYVIASFYRRTSRQVKRIESTTRSAILARFSEQVVGVASIRVFGQQQYFIAAFSEALDYHNRFYYATVMIRRWLAVRLQAFASVLILAVSIFGVCLSRNVSPAVFSVALVYTIQTSSSFGHLINLYTSLEQNMDSWERLLHYGALKLEASPRLKDDPGAEWPSNGRVTFDKVDLRYRPSLPLVLKRVSFGILPGEKVGIVGRTGAGKSSCLQALCRLVELSAGSITVDGVDISKIGLDTLRQAISAIPQEPLLFSGTMRENLDPECKRSDADLNDALRRCGLLETENSDKERLKKFRLDAEVRDEGSNFSGGERQLVALCRALVKNRKVLMLDEATSSVDPETDALIQRTIRREFKTATLLCIAHRLATIAFYDRVIVLEDGTVAEFDTPMNLFNQKDSIFRGMCDAAQLDGEAILRIRNADN